MPTTRGALAAVAVGKKIYVSGGGGIPQGMQLPDGLVGGGPVELYGTLEVFDTDTNNWSKLAPMPTPRNHHSIALSTASSTPSAGGWAPAIRAVGRRTCG